MPIILMSATLLSHHEDHAAGIIAARVRYTFNNGADEEKNHAGIPMSAVDAVAIADGRLSRTVEDLCAVIKAGLGPNAADLALAVAPMAERGDIAVAQPLPATVAVPLVPRSLL